MTIPLRHRSLKSFQTYLFIVGYTTHNSSINNSIQHHCERVQVNFRVGSVSVTHGLYLTILYSQCVNGCINRWKFNLDGKEKCIFFNWLDWKSLIAISLGIWIFYKNLFNPFNFQWRDISSWKFDLFMDLAPEKGT